MARKKAEVTAEQIFQFAKDGLGIAQMAVKVGLKYQGLYARIQAEQDLKDALEFGRRLCQENLDSTMRDMVVDDSTKPQNRIQAYNVLMRNTAVDRARELQSTVLGQLSNEELQVLREHLARKELESRLAKSTPVREPVTDSNEPQTVKVKDAG